MEEKLVHPADDPGVVVDPNDPAWQLDGALGETLDPDSEGVLEARRAAGDPTAPEVGA